MSEFHFIRPLWLLALLALPLLVWLIKRLQISSSGWTSVLPPHLANNMIEQGASAKGRSLWPALLMYALVITALAGPTWQKLPQPVYQVERGSVIVMDMSYSMYSTDLSPNRLTRARYKATDLLDHINEGDVGLIAYAGDAFTISPLTQDINNIKLLLPSLSPDLMPAWGSNPLAALELAHQMLANAGHIEGDIYWFTDGIDNEDIQDLSQWSTEHQHTVNILGIGTTEGAPIKLPNGELMKDDRGAIVIPKLTDSLLYGVAGKSGGLYQTMRIDNGDINQLVANQRLAEQEQETSELSSSELETGDLWQEAGPYLLIGVLVLLLPYFRRGLLLSIVALVFILPTEKAMALDWQSLWKTKDQQGQQAFNNQDFEKAAKAFNDPMWKGSSLYKSGDYQGAAEAFSQLNTAEGFYNQGNALAKAQQLDEALAAYQKALELAPEHSDAQANKQLLEQLKQQQEQQQNQQNSDQSQDNQQNSEQNQQQSDEQQNGDSSGQSQQNEQESADSQQSQQGQNSQSEQNQQSDSQQQNDQQQQNDGQANEQQNQASKQQAQANEQEQLESQDNDGEQQAVTASEQASNQEQAQKHQQLLKKVTDDPYLLLRNKMQLEYQKRRQEGTNNGVKKKW